MGQNKELETAKKRAVYLLGGKDYSKKELMNKLLNNYSRESCEAAVEQMVEYGYLDEKRYANRLAHAYIEVRKYGKSRAKMMMIQKGLAPELADEVLSAYSSEDMVEEIAEVIRKKYSDRICIDGLEGRKELQKVMAALARRGYGYEDIKTAISLVKDGFSDYDFYDE